MARGGVAACVKAVSAVMHNSKIPMSAQTCEPYRMYCSSPVQVDLEHFAAAVRDGLVFNARVQVWVGVEGEGGRCESGEGEGGVVRVSVLPDEGSVLQRCMQLVHSCVSATPTTLSSQPPLIFMPIVHPKQTCCPLDFPLFLLTSHLSPHFRADRSP